MQQGRPLLFYEVHGTHGPYLLLVHGILSSRAQWIPNLGALTAFCRPVVIELFGHGRSPSPDDPESYTPENYVLEFERIRCELCVEQLFLCGQSLGASLTLRYALYHPERIIAQIFTNSRSALSDESYDDGIKILVKRLEEDGHSVIDNFPLHPARSRHLPPEIKNALIEDIKLINIQGFSHTMLNTVTKCSVREILNQNKISTLLIVGRRDRQFAPLREVAEKIMPELDVLVLDGGHAVNIDAAEQFNSAVREFISQFINI